MDLCDEAIQYGFASVCVNPTYTKLVADQLKGSAVAVCSVVGFPLGTHVPEIEALEAIPERRKYTISYEDLVNDYDAQVGALLRFMKPEGATETSIPRSHDGVKSSSVGRAKQAFDVEELRSIERVLAET